VNARQARKIRCGINAANRMLQSAGRAPRRISSITSVAPVGLVGDAMRERLTRAMSPYRYGGDYGARAGGYALWAPEGGQVIGLRRAPVPDLIPGRSYFGYAR
jgi:hypothetical protein